MARESRFNGSGRVSTRVLRGYLTLRIRHAGVGFTRQGGANLDPSIKVNISNRNPLPTYLLTDHIDIPILRPSCHPSVSAFLNKTALGCGHQHRQDVFQLAQLVSIPSLPILYHVGCKEKPLGTMAVDGARSKETNTDSWCNRVHHPFNGGRRSAAPGGASDSPHTK